MFKVGQTVICSGFEFWIVSVNGDEYVIRSDRGTRIAYEDEMEAA